MTNRLIAPCDRLVTLPPVDVRNDDFKDPFSPHFERIPTPLTPIGLVDKRQLIKVVQHTLNTAYHWPASFNDSHHTLWPKSDYEDTPDALVNPREFRNLAINLMDFPRPFHNWAHRVTIPPKKPNQEVMYLATEAQATVTSLHRIVSIAKKLSRDSVISEARLTDRLTELYDEYATTLAAYRHMPEEFQFVDPEACTSQSPEELILIGGELGRVATAATVNITTRYIRQTTFAPKRITQAA